MQSTIAPWKLKNGTEIEWRKPHKKRRKKESVFASRSAYATLNTEISQQKIEPQLIINEKKMKDLWDRDWECKRGRRRYLKKKQKGLSFAEVWSWNMPLDFGDSLRMNCEVKLEKASSVVWYSSSVHISSSINNNNNGL